MTNRAYRQWQAVISVFPNSSPVPTVGTREFTRGAKCSSGQRSHHSATGVVSRLRQAEVAIVAKPPMGAPLKTSGATVQAIPFVLIGGLNSIWRGLTVRVHAARLPRLRRFTPSRSRIWRMRSRLTPYEVAKIASDSPASYRAAMFGCSVRAITVSMLLYILAANTDKSIAANPSRRGGALLLPYAV